MPQINTDLCRSFKKIVSGGWAQHSNGDVESPTGHFAYIPVSINELVELSAACLDDDDDAPVEGQYYVFVEDSDGNGSLYIYGSTREALDHFNRLTADYERWLGVDEMVHSSGADPHPRTDECEEAGCYEVTEKQYLVHECGEAFDSLETAVAHACNVDTDSYYQIKPESEAL